MPLAGVGAGAEARPAPLMPASCSMHRVKLRSGIPGGAHALAAAPLLAPGDGVAVTFPALLPTLTLRRDSAEPRPLLHGASHRPVTPRAGPRLLLFTAPADGRTGGRGGSSSHSLRRGRGDADPQMQSPWEP